MHETVVELKFVVDNENSAALAANVGARLSQKLFNDANKAWLLMTTFVKSSTLEESVNEEE